MAKTEAALPAADVHLKARGTGWAALGYVGSFVATASDTRTGRADPKDKISVVQSSSGAATELTKEPVRYC